MNKSTINQYEILGRIGKIALASGFVLLAYKFYSGNLLAYYLGLLIIVLSVIWFHFVKKWKREYEMVHLFSEEMIQALAEGRDFQSGMEGFLSKHLDTVSVELPQQDFRDPIEYSQIKLAEFFDKQRRIEANDSSRAVNSVEVEPRKEAKDGGSNSAPKLCIVGYVIAGPELFCPDEDLIIALDVEGFELTQNSNRDDCSVEPASYHIVCPEERMKFLLDGRVGQGTVLQITGDFKTVEWTDDETGSYFFADELLASEVKILSNEKKPYTYVEADSSLYGPDGTFLKKLYCPKAVSWNQLVADDPKNRSRGCNLCSKRVMNLDVVPVMEVQIALQKNPSHCLFGSEKSVRYLRDPNRPKHPRELDGVKPVTIHTARSIEDIKRGVSEGFWPDVRLVTYNTKQLKSKFAVRQNVKTGDIDIRYDLREGLGRREGWNVVVDFTYYYPYYQATPLAAYLVPKGLPAGTPVIVLDPIEDILAHDFGQGDSARATKVTGIWDGQRIVLNTDEVKVSYSLG